MTAVEAVAAAEAIAALPDHVRREIRARVLRVASKIGTGGVEGGNWEINSGDSDGLFGSCPLLVNGRCSIYDARPLVCRAYGYAADAEGVYFGCEVLEPILRRADRISLTSLQAARNLIPDDRRLDREGRALPVAGVLSEFLDRLLP